MCVYVAGRGAGTVTDVWEDTVRDVQEGHRPAGQVGWISSNMQPNVEQIGTNMCKSETAGRKDGFSNDLRCHQAPGRRERHAQLGHLT